MSIAKPPTYAELIAKDLFQRECEICADCHPIKELCKSKPKFPPSAYFPKCVICSGFHPRGRCFFEYLRETLFTPSMCNNCQFVHIGFCKEALLCQYCNTKHNFADGCIRQTCIDLSDNLCSKCDAYHSLHCPSDLPRIQTDVILWCNRCKLDHTFMNCVAFCNRCYRRHREGPCPESWTFCFPCGYCHQGETCPKPELRPATNTKDIEETPCLPSPPRSPFLDLEHYLAL